MKQVLIRLASVLAVIIILTLPCQAGSASSFFKKGKQAKVLTAEKRKSIFKIDEEALAIRSIKFELAYLNNQLRDPSALVTKLSLTAPDADPKKVLKVFRQRKEKLTKQLLEHAKKIASGQKAKGNIPSPLARPFPPPPPGKTPYPMASGSIEDAMKELGWSTQQGKSEFSSPCEIRKGWLTHPEQFSIGEWKGACESSSSCEGGMSYQMNQATLPFYGKMKNDEDENAYYYFFAELGYKFPAPLCDSWLTWEFELGAGAGMSSDAGSSVVYLDCLTLEMEDIHVEGPTQTISPSILGGSVLEVSENAVWESIAPMTFTGRINVKQRKESGLIVGLFVLMMANSGETITTGQYQIFNMFDDFHTGVRYRFEPHEKPM